jgi:hypothetical protein
MICCDVLNCKKEIPQDIISNQITIGVFKWTLCPECFAKITKWTEEFLAKGTLVPVLNPFPEIGLPSIYGPISEEPPAYTITIVSDNTADIKWADNSWTEFPGKLGNY